MTEGCRAGAAEWHERTQLSIPWNERHRWLMSDFDKAAREKVREQFSDYTLCDGDTGLMASCLLKALDALDAAARLQAQAATNTRCKWGGGNDYLACRTCGLEYDYRTEERPACGAEATITRLRARVSELEAAQMFDIGNGEFVHFSQNGRFHGWIFRRGSDGQYVSVRQMNAVSDFPPASPFALPAPPVGDR